MGKSPKNQVMFLVKAQQPLHLKIIQCKEKLTENQPNNPKQNWSNTNNAMLKFDSTVSTF